MSKLLSANFSRLYKSWEFRIFAAAALIISAAMTFSGAEAVQQKILSGYETQLDDFAFQFAPYMGIFAGMFISLFLGTEFSDGTVRNKLIAGHTKAKIYLANYITCLAASALMTALWFAGIIPGLFIIGGFEMGASEVALYFITAIGFSAVFCAVFVLIGMFSRNRAITVVVTVAVWTVITLLGSGVNDRLNEVEFNGGLAMINGEFVFIDDTPNPLYLTGAARTLFEALLRILPSGQAIVMTTAELSTPIADIVISVVTSIVLTALGVVLFRKKDLK